MYSEWVSLQTSIQNDSSHLSVLKRFPSTVGRDIVAPIVKSIAQGLSINNNDQPSKLTSIEEVDWTMEVICHGLSLPFTEHELLKDCVNIYCDWLSCLLRPKLCVPKPILEMPNQYSVKMLAHLYNLFVPREKTTVDQIQRQVLVCHRTLRTLETIAKESVTLTRDTWEVILKFLLAITDTLLAPPKEKDGINDQLAERVVSVLFELWLLSCAQHFPIPSLWRTFRDMCANWRHHEAVIVQWNRVNLALTGPLLKKLYGAEHPPLIIGIGDCTAVMELTKECVSKLSDECLVQCWFRFLHIISNPVDLCRVDVICETPKFLHYALSSERVIEPHQHECLKQLPDIFRKAMRGVSNIMDAFLGNNQRITISPSKASASSLTATPSPLAPPLIQPSLVHYASRPSLAPARSTCDSILHVLGAWLFDASMCHVTKNRRPGSLSHRTGSISNSTSMELKDFNFDSGRAEACGAICRLFGSKRTGEAIQSVYLARFYMSIYHALSLSQPINGEVLTFTLFHMADLFKVDLPGVNVLLPRILSALEAVLSSSCYGFHIHEQVPEVELRKACIHILMSAICLPLHYGKLAIKDLYSGEQTCTFLSLKSSISSLILNSLKVEKDSNNSIMLLGSLALLIQDFATHEYRETEMNSDSTATNGTLTPVQRGSLTITQSMEAAHHDTIPEVVLRKNTLSTDIEYEGTAGILGNAASLICDNLLSSWKADYSLALSALEVLMLLAKIKLQIVSSQMCRSTVIKICNLITHLCNRPPKNQTRDLHSLIIAAFLSLSHWLLEHPYLLQEKECLYNVLEVIELGISGKKSQGPDDVLLKGSKERLPVSLRVKDAAEALLMCLTDQVDSFPCPCGADSLYSALSERDFSSDPEMFKYYALGNAVIIGIAEEKGKGVMGQVKTIIRGPFGRQTWVMQPKMEAASSASRPVQHIPRPAGVEGKSQKGRVPSRWFPPSVDSIPPVMADHFMPTLDDLAKDVDASFVELLEKHIRLEEQAMGGLRMSAAPESLQVPVPQCQPPTQMDYMQAARMVLSQIGLLSKDFEKEASNATFPSSLSSLASKRPGFFEALSSLDRIPNRTLDTVFLYYVRPGQTDLSEILANSKSYKGVDPVYREFLLSLGWPVCLATHAGWTGRPCIKPELLPPTDESESIPSTAGPGAFDGTRWLLYWADARSEVAFIVPTAERLELLRMSEDGVKKTGTPNDVTFHAGENDEMAGSNKSLDTKVRLNGPDVPVMVIWLETIEAKAGVPWEQMLDITNSACQETSAPSEYLIIYVTALENGLLRVHVDSHLERYGAAGPLVDGVICSKRTLGTLVKQTSVNMANRKRLHSELSQIPHNKRLLKMQEIINKYRVSQSEAEFFTDLFLT